MTVPEQQLSLPDSRAGKPSDATIVTASSTRGIVAATIGNALEWFDIAVYALLAIYIGRNFFPVTTRASSLSRPSPSSVSLTSSGPSEAWSSALLPTATA